MKTRLCFLTMFGLSIILASSLQAATQQPITLTLKDAIFLALRDNPTLESNELGRITQKYALVVAQNAFEPQYTLTASYDRNWNTVNNAKDTTYAHDIKPSVNLKNGYGTTLTLANTNAVSNSNSGFLYRPSLSLTVEQPLIQGFGKAIVEAALNNAIDTEQENRLNYKKSAIDTLDTVINDYLTLWQAYEQLAVDQASLKTYQQLVKNDQIQIKAGQMAANNIIQDQASAATQEETIESQKNTIQQNKATLLDDIGLEPDANIKLPTELDLQGVESLLTGGKVLPDLATCQNLTLSNNPTYRADGIALRTLRRALTTAEDGLRWKLDLTASETTGNGSGKNGNGDMQSLSNHRNHAEAVGLDLTIPIDDVSAKQTLIAAQVGLNQGLISFDNETRQLKSTVKTDVNNINSTKAQYTLASQAEKLQKQAIDIAQLKEKAGLISNFEFIQTQQQLSTAQQTFVSSKIAYLQALETLDAEMGTTLDLLGVKIRY